MLNGDANENGNKINGYNKQKKQIICTCSTLFCTFHCRCFLQMQCRFARLKRQTSSLHIIFYGGIVRNSSPLFSVTRSSSFYVIQVRVDIKNNVKKDSTLFLFFLSKSLGWLCDFPPKLKTPRVNCLWCHTC